MPQHRESLRPKDNLVPVKKETAATQIQHKAIELQSLGVRLRRRVGIAIGHRPAILRHG